MCLAQFTVKRLVKWSSQLFGRQKRIILSLFPQHTGKPSFACRNCSSHAGRTRTVFRASYLGPSTRAPPSTGDSTPPLRRAAVRGRPTRAMARLRPKWGRAFRYGRSRAVSFHHGAFKSRAGTGHVRPSCPRKNTVSVLSFLLSRGYSLVLCKM